MGFVAEACIMLFYMLRTSVLLQELENLTYEKQTMSLTSIKMKSATNITITGN